MSDLLDMRVLKTTSERRSVPDAWRYRRPKHLPWLADLLVRLLAKVGCLHPHGDTVVVHTAQIIPGNIIEKINRSLLECARQHEDVDRIVLGYEAYEELIGELHRSSLTFLIDASRKGPRNDAGPFYNGILVQVVPWVSGAAVIPRIKP